MSKYTPAAVVETAILLYMLTIPFGATLPGTVRGVIVAALCGAIVWSRFDPRGSSMRIRLLIPLVIFTASTGLSIACSVDPSMSLDRARYLPIALIACIGLQIGLRSWAAMDRLAIVLAACVVLLSVDALYQLATDRSLLVGAAMFRDRVTGSVPHPNDYALIPLLMPIVAAFVFNHGKQETAGSDHGEPDAGAVRRRIFMIAFVALTVLAFTAIVASRSRNAMLGLAVGLGLMGALAKGSRRSVAAIGAVLLVTIIVVYLFDLAEVRDRVASLERLREDGRIGVWLVGWQMFIEAPIVGQGPHSFDVFYPLYLAKVQLPEGYTPEVGLIPWAHNIYLEMLCERGVIGLTSFLLLAGAAVAAIIRLLRSDGQHRAQTYAVGALGSLAAFAAMGVFDLTFFKDWVLLLYLVLCAIAVRLPDLASDQPSIDHVVSAPRKTRRRAAPSPIPPSTAHRTGSSTADSPDTDSRRSTIRPTS